MRFLQPHTYKGGVTKASQVAQATLKSQPPTCFNGYCLTIVNKGLANEIYIFLWDIMYD